jgi:hypothetical protein
VDKLKQLRKSGRRWTIYHQAGFSIFGASYFPVRPDDDEYTKSYKKLLLKECKELKDLATSSNTTLKLLLYPKRSQATEPEYMCSRYGKLLDCLKKIQKNKAVQIAYGLFPEPNNRFLVDDEFTLEGYKANQMTGYQMSILRYEKDKIEAARQEFEDNWKRFFQSNETAIQQIRDERKECCGKECAHL